jgi:predicted GNAT family N-acyltransferase
MNGHLQTDLDIVTIPFQKGPLYLQWLLLRQAVLRTPLHLTFAWADLLAEADQHHVVLLDASSQQVLGGYLLKTPASACDKRAVLRQMAVDPNFQGFGFGGRLVRHAEGLAVQLGLPTMQLSARLSAVMFYEKLGYKRVGQPYTHLGIDHIEMDKPLIH